MTARSRTEDQVKAALRVVEEAEATSEEKAEMLMEVAMGLQQKPQAVEDLLAALVGEFQEIGQGHHRVPGRLGGHLHA